MKTIDLNCDVAEGMNNEGEIFPFISSCNISCGRHAGDLDTIKRVIDLAIKHDLAIGAHPSFDDRANFGRVEINLSDAQLTTLVSQQVHLLKELTENAGGKLSHVKPHGALYNMAARSSEMSAVIVKTIVTIDPNLALVGLAESATKEACNGKLRFIAEGFADRKYASQTQLMARVNGGLIEEIGEVEAQLILLLRERKIQTLDGPQPLFVDSICLHGDTPDAVLWAKKINEVIRDMGWKIKAC